MQPNHRQHLKESCQIIFMKLINCRKFQFMTNILYHTCSAEKGIFTLFQQTYHMLNFFVVFFILIFFLFSVLINASLVFLFCVSFYSSGKYR